MNRDHRGWLFLFSSIGMLFIPLFIGVYLHRIEPLFVFLIGTPILLIIGISYEKPLTEGVK